MQNSTPVQHSPPFGYLSPPIDGCDARSEDGDTLQTPLTEHDERHQPYAVYHLHQHGFSHDLFTAEHHSHVSSDGPAKPEASHHHESLSALLTPCPPEKPHGHASLGSDGLFPGLDYSPPHALDLAHASLEFNPFAASFAATLNSMHSPTESPEHSYAQDAREYDMSQDQDSFDFMLERYTEQDPNEGSTAISDSLEIPALPSLSISSDSLNVFDMDSDASPPPLLLEPVSSDRPDLQRAPVYENLMQAKGRTYSPRFPSEHVLNPFFVGGYELGDELGAGGYGFVMTARHRIEGYEVAVKFIIKDKVPEHAWWDDELLGRVPTEVMIMSLVEHENIIKCIDLFEDELYYYLVGSYDPLKHLLSADRLR